MSRKHQQRPRPAAPPSGDKDAGGEDAGGPGDRLQKVLAAAGIGSRRDCEELIREGRVEVDKQVVTELGTRVDPLKHEIRVDGEALRKPQTLYYAVNKPMGVVTTNDDPDRRTRVVDLVPTEERVFAVGRLDRSSEGLILVTNDGEFANRITHPRYGVEKTYLVRVAGAPGSAELTRLQKGVYLSDGVCRVQSIVTKKRHKGSTDLVIVLDEGRNRELRRILARVGHKVLRLKRIAVGPIKLAGLPTGSWRRLMPSEINALLAVAKEKRRESKHKQRGPRPKIVGDSLRESPPSTRAASGPPQQQQALMAEPLSLDDLLRDDLDEGGLVTSGGPEPIVTAGQQAATELGEVLDYDFDEQPTPSTTPRPPRALAGPSPGGKFKKKPSRGHRPEQRGARSEQRGARSEQREAPPRKDFGGKRGAKRPAGPPQEARGEGGRQGGKSRLGEKSRLAEKPKVRRGAKSVGKKFGKPGRGQGGKGKGRR